MQFCRCRRIRLTRVCKQLSAIASSSPLGSAAVVDRHLEDERRCSTPAKLNKDGKITSVTQARGKTTTKKLGKLFPALESVNVGMSKKVRHHA